MLAYVIKSSREEIGREGHGTLGRTAMQKIPFFLQVLGVPMGYRFDIYTYGPFCAEILRDIELLEVDEVVVDGSNDKKSRSDYLPGPAIDILLTRHSDFIEEHKETIDQVVQALAAADPSQLELVATVLYLFRWVEATGKVGSLKDEVFRRFQEIKPGKFHKQDLENAHKWLKSVNLVGD